MSIFGVPIFPEQASSFARDVDELYFFILAVSAFFSLVVAVLVIVLGLTYRRKRANEVGARIEGHLAMELLWSVIPTVIAMVMFGWGASVFYHLRRPPDEAMQIYAVGKQWMWKFQHPEISVAAVGFAKPTSAWLMSTAGRKKSAKTSFGPK
jgi:cytochrome c oxidase subunit 2